MFPHSVSFHEAGSDPIKAFFRAAGMRIARVSGATDAFSRCSLWILTAVTATGPAFINHTIHSAAFPLKVCTPTGVGALNRGLHKHWTPVHTFKRAAERVPRSHAASLSLVRVPRGDRSSLTRGEGGFGCRWGAAGPEQLLRIHPDPTAAPYMGRKRGSRALPVHSEEKRPCLTKRDGGYRRRGLLSGQPGTTRLQVCVIKAPLELFIYLYYFCACAPRKQTQTQHGIEGDKHEAVSCGSEPINCARFRGARCRRFPVWRHFAPHVYALLG